MKFELQDTFETDLATFEQALADPRLPEVLSRAMSSIKKVEEIGREDDGRLLKRRVRFVPDQEVPSFARGKIKPEMLEWVEESTYDRTQHRLEYRFLPNIPERWNDRFRGFGSYSLTEASGKVRRVLSGEVVVKVTFVGGMAERYVVGQLTRTYEQEAEALRGFLRQVRAG